MQSDSVLTEVYVPSSQGQEGVSNVLQILNDELKHAMLFAGTARIADIKYVARSLVLLLLRPHGSSLTSVHYHCLCASASRTYAAGSRRTFELAVVEVEAVCCSSCRISANEMIMLLPVHSHSRCISQHATFGLQQSHCEV
jgi:hypothetical protein